MQFYEVDSGRDLSIPIGGSGVLLRSQSCFYCMESIQHSSSLTHPGSEKNAGYPMFFVLTAMDDSQQKPNAENENMTVCTEPLCKNAMYPHIRSE